MPPVTLLLRTLDAEPWLPALLPRLASQSERALELLVVDSGSRDRTIPLCRDAGARIVEIPPETFTHAVSTNLGFREARGDIVAMLSQDALPTDDAWLSRLVRPLAGEKVAGAFGRQVPRDGCFPLERWELERCYPESGPPGAVYSNVNSAAWKSAWAERPFDESLRIAEDRTWAEAWIRDGHRVAYAPDAAVFHSHAYTLGEVYRRCRAEAQARRATDGIREGWGVVLRGWPRQTARDARRLAAEKGLTAWPRAAAYRFAQLLGVVVGGRA